MSARAVITSMGHFHPDNVIENAICDALDIGSNADWVTERTGIESRRSVLLPEDLKRLHQGEETLASLRAASRVTTIAEMGAQAWRVLSERAGDAINDCDLLTCGTSVPDYDIPANACTIGAEIGAECTAFDLNSACSSFVTNLHTVQNLLRSGAHRKAAIFTPERYSLRLNYQDRASCVLFGDGCAAALVEADAPAGLEVVDTFITSSPSKYAVVQIPDGGFFYQNGKAVQKFAISRTIEITKKILDRNHLKVSDLRLLVGHQANLRMLTSAVKKLGLSAEQHVYNVDRFGNQGGAGAPAVLSTHWDELSKGDYVVVAVVGSGLTWGSALLRKL